MPIMEHDSLDKYGPYNEADLTDPDKKLGVKDYAGIALGVGLAALTTYRGLRGAPLFPFNRRFWLPLEKDIEFNAANPFIKKPIILPDNWFTRKFKIGTSRAMQDASGTRVGRERVISSIPSIKSLNARAAGWDAAKKEFEEQIAAGVKGARKARYEKANSYIDSLKSSKYGLRTPREGLAYLFSRTTEGIPEFLEYLGFEKSSLVKKLKKIPEWILGGTPSKYPGFHGAPEDIQKILKSTGFSPGARTASSVIGRTLLRGALPAYAGVLAYNYLDYRIRRSDAFESTPLDQGITAAGAGMWVNSRMFMQKTLDNLGVLSVHKHAETLFPGYLRTAGTIAGLTLGILTKKKPLTSIMMGFGMGVVGYAAERALSYTPEQLQRIYSGEEKIPVRAGRWWEFGRTPYEGGKIQYYRPHWYPLMKSRYKEQGPLYPSEDWKWQHHWLVGPLTGNKPDKYAWEKEYYKERPYPVTGGIFEDVPIVGPLLDATIGKILKPRKYMHVEDWVSSEGGIVRQPGQKEKVRRVPSDAAQRLGIQGIESGGMGEVVAPDSIKRAIGETEYRVAEWMGLPGFYAQSGLEQVTGRSSLFEQAVLQSPNRATGYERSYWEKDLGGLMGSTEIYRRFFPHRRRQVQEYNPIPNAMGERHPWLPGNDYFIDFKHGDPFIKVPLGEARLPGKGYEALNELHSNIPGVYDAVDRLLILADVAPYSDEYRNYNTIVTGMIKAGVIDKSWADKVGTAKAQRQSTMKKYEFQPRHYTRMRDQVEKDLTEENAGTKESAIALKAAAAWENITHAASTTFMPGVSFLSGKVNPRRTAEEHYEMFQVYGRESAFWQHPMRDFLSVYGKQIRHAFQKDYIPPDVQKRRNIEEYFDKLEYLKYRQLESRARAAGDFNLATNFSARSKETMYGLGQYPSLSRLFRAIPKAERDYFSEFVEARGEDRDKIRQVLPEYMRRIYENQWRQKDEKAGRETDTVAIQDKQLSDYFATHYLPSKNWLGWHPDVDLDKVKLKVAKNEAMDIHDFNLWGSQEEEMRREPVPNIAEFNVPNPAFDNARMRKRIIEELTGQGVNPTNIEFTQVPSDRRRMSIDFDVDVDQSDQYSNRNRLHKIGVF